ncbi:MAG: hypothetical protein HRT35_36415 [Algicola sp.]|nr:hypothetical protein [Algicola sp.]
MHQFLCLMASGAAFVNANAAVYGKVMINVLNLLTQGGNVFTSDVDTIRGCDSLCIASQA